MGICCVRDIQHRKGFGMIADESIEESEMRERMRKSCFKEEAINRFMEQVKCSSTYDHKMIRQEFEDSFSSWELARLYYRLHNFYLGDVTPESLSKEMDHEGLTFILTEDVLNKFIQVLLDDDKFTSDEVQNAMEITTQARRFRKVDKDFDDIETDVSDQFDHSKPPPHADRIKSLFKQKSLQKEPLDLL